MRILILFGLVVFLHSLHAQDMREHWIFGDSIHLQFTSEGPVELSTVPLYSTEGASSISDTYGNLLFYGNQEKILNKTHLVMSGGDSLADKETHSTTTQGVLILPLDSLSNKYIYVYSVHHSIGIFGESLAYCIVNFDSINTLGYIDPSERRIMIIDELFAEQMQAVKHANGVDWWLIVRTRSPALTKSDAFRVYLNQGATFNLVGIFNEGLPSSFIGEMAVNSDGSQIALVSHIGGLIQLFDFDRCLGEISNPRIVLNNGASVLYGCAFSPSGKYLYYNYYNSEKLYQVDLESLDIVEIFSGFGDLCVIAGQLELGPDNKIYTPYSTICGGGGEPYSRYLGVIESPDIGGIGCNFAPLGVGPLTRANRGFGLPNHPNYYLGPLVGSPCDTLSDPDTTTAIQPILVAQAEPCFELRATSGSGFVTLNIEPSFLNSTIELYNSSGAQVYTGQVNTTNSMLSTASWTPGMYVARLRTTDGSCPAQKFVVAP